MSGRMYECVLILLMAMALKDIYEIITHMNAKVS